MALDQEGKVLYRKEDMDKILATFKKWDVNGNGSISKQELGNILDHIGVQDKDRQSIFESIDTSGNGRIEYEEFVAWLYGTLCPVPIRTSALSDRYQLSIDAIKLDLEDDPSFSGWFHDASSIRPFLLFSDSITRKRYFQSPEGRGLKSQLSFDHKSKREIWQFEVGEGLQAVEIEICLPKTMQSLRGHQVLGRATLTLDAIGAQIAEGAGTATVFVEAFRPKESEGSEKGQNLVARLTLKLVAAGSLWANWNVKVWKQQGLPELDLEGVSKVLRILSDAPDRQLLKEALQAAEVNFASRLQNFRSWTGPVADKELNEVLVWLQKLEQTLGTSSELRRHSAKDCKAICTGSQAIQTWAWLPQEFEQLGERLASAVLSASLNGQVRLNGRWHASSLLDSFVQKVADHELMRSALTFACAVVGHSDSACGLVVPGQVEKVFQGSTLASGS